MERRSPWPALRWPGPIPFAHQGGAGEAPENTLAAFEAAWRLGYRHFETDVHATSDGVLVAFHDHRLDRVTDRSGRIGDLPWREVAAARVDGEPIPRLEDILGSFPGAVVNIDPKHDAAVDPLIATIRRCDALDRVIVGSFSDRRLRRIRRALGPRLCTSAGPLGVLRLRAAAAGLPVGAPRVGAAQIPVSTGIGPVRVPLATTRVVAAARRAGIQVHIWTVDDADEMARLLDLGVDGIMTDRPRVLRDVLRSRGAWFGG